MKVACASIEKRLEDLEKSVRSNDSCLSVQNSAIRTVSDCLERAKVALHEKINDLHCDMDKEVSEIFDAISDVHLRCDGLIKNKKS